MADRIPVKAKYAAGSPVDVIALQEFEPTDTIALNLISGFVAGVTAELANNSVSALSDVNYPIAPNNGEVLAWNNTSGMWEPSTVSMPNELVKVSATDTTAGYLSSEITTGNGITLNIQNPAADEKLQLVADVYLTTVNGNTMAVFLDASRANKELSVESVNYIWAEAAVGNNDWIQIQHATDAHAGYIMPFNGTIVSIVMHCENTNGKVKDINYYIGGANQGSIGQFTGTSEQSFTNTSLNIDVAAGDKLRLRGASGQGAIQDTNIQIRIKWRV